MAKKSIDVMTLADIARHLGIKPQSMANRAKNPNFPKPVIETTNGSLYSRAEIELYAQKYPRRRSNGND